MFEKEDTLYHCTIDLYRTSNDMAGLKNELQNKKALCGHCNNYFNQKLIRFDREGVAICPSCILQEKIGIKREDVVSVPHIRGD